MTYFATITQTRHGWKARFNQRGYQFDPSELFPNGGSMPDVSWLTFDRVGLTRWRRSRAGIERAAARVLRRLNTEVQRTAASYEYNGAD